MGHLRRLAIFGVLMMMPVWSADARMRPDAVDVAARAAMARTGARGLAIATIGGGRVLTVRAWGDRNARGDALTPDTVMYGASLTKAVFGYLAVQLASEGRLDLDRPIATMLPKPLPDYGNLDAYGNWGDLKGDDRWLIITPRMTLNHTTGFANFAFLERDGSCASISFPVRATLIPVKASRFCNSESSRGLAWTSKPNFSAAFSIGLE